MEITVVGTIQIGAWRECYFLHSLTSVTPIAHLLSWRLNIAGERRERSRDRVIARWPKALITTDDNEISTYDLVSAQLDSLPDNALVYPWIEDMWFVCPHVSLFHHVLEKFVHSQAEVMAVSHLVTLWEEFPLMTPTMWDRFYSEYLIDLPAQEKVWEKLPNAYWVVSVSSIFKVNLFREVIEHQRECLSHSCSPAGLEIRPEPARGFLATRSFTRLVPHFHVFREIIASGGYPRRCVSWDGALRTVSLRDAGDRSGAFPREVMRGMQC